MSACKSPQVVVEPPPPCPEMTKEQFTAMLDKAPPEVIDWYWNLFDPYCEALYEASRDHSE